MESKDLENEILNKPKELSKHQKPAVISNALHIRVIAGAGAGKTEILTRKIVHLLIIKKVDPSSIVAFTFTEKAAQNMKSRIYARMQHLGGDDVCSKLGDMFIGTIHGYCAYLLEKHFGYGDYGVLDENQEMAFLMRMGWSLRLGNSGYYSENCRNFLKSTNVVYAEMIDRGALFKKAPNFARSFQIYEQKLTDYKRLTFNRMIQLAIDHLEKDCHVLNDITYLIVDEYQDINRAQERLIRLIGNKGSIFIVGDPRQTIYQFRGSEEKCFEDFVKYYEDTAKIPISENRRSSQRIIDLANVITDSFSKEWYEPLEYVRPDNGAAYFASILNETKEAYWVCDQIERYVEGGAASYGDIALLFRSVGTSAPAFIDELRRREIPFVVSGKVGLFRRPEIRALGKLFAWFDENGFWQINPWKWEDQISGDTLLEEALHNWREGTGLSVYQLNLSQQLHEFRDRIRQGEYPTFTDAYYAVLTEIGYHQLDPSNRFQTAMLSNLGRFGKILADFETAHSLGGKQRNWKYDLHNLCWFLNSYATSSYDEHPGEEHEKIDAVTVSTIHQSKGLEWSLVFIPAFVDKRFPSSMVGREQDWLIPRSLFHVRKYEGDVESEKKLLYVAATRAKDVLVISEFRQTKNGTLKRESEFKGILESSGLILLTDADNLPIQRLSTSGNAEDLRTFAAGEIIDYGKCPHLYRLRHLWGYESGLSEYLGYGKTLHFCMRRASELIQQGYNSRSAVSTAVDESFFMPFMKLDRMRKIKDAAKRHLVRFVREHEEDMLRIRDVESRVEFTLEKAIVAGKVDVILHDGDEIEVREYKTSDKVISEEEVAMQIRLYTHGLRVVGEKVRSGSVAFLEDSRVESVNVKDLVIGATVMEVKNRIADITRGNFKACPGAHCEQCDYSTICKWRMQGEEC